MLTSTNTAASYPNNKSHRRGYLMIPSKYHREIPHVKSYVGQSPPLRPPRTISSAACGLLGVLPLLAASRSSYNHSGAMHYHQQNGHHTSLRSYRLSANWKFLHGITGSAAKPCMYAGLSESPPILSLLA